jgi:Reverse transcriptase (RNA-dependent DNA polymerase)
VETLDMLGVTDMIQYFPQRRHFRDGATWCGYRNGKSLRSTCDYVFSDDNRRRFQRIRITDPRTFDSDHFAISFTLRAKNQQHHQQYVKLRKSFPLHTNLSQTTDADHLLSKFPVLYVDPRQRIRPQVLPSTPKQRASWVSDCTWKLVDTRASLRRQNKNNSTLPQILQPISQQIRKSLKRDRTRRTNEAGDDIEALLALNDIRAAWNRIRGWYQQANTRHTKPSLQDMDNIHATFTQLYATPTNLPIHNIPINYVAEDILDTPPTDFEIQLAVQKLRLHKAPGPSGLRAEEIQQWMRQEDKTDWNHLTTLIRHIFQTGQVPQRLAFSTLVLLPKHDGGVRGIGLLEPIWKVIALIIKDRIIDAVQFDDSLHGFLPRRGTGSAILEAKLHLDIQTATGNTRYQAFIDISKAYDSVCRQKLLYILRQYGAGPNVLNILSNFWQQLWVAPKQAGFYGPSIKSDRGVTQGDPLSPILFNLIIDAIIRETKRVTTHLDGFIIFYADDGLIASNSLENIQYYLNVINTLLSYVGLNINAEKTKILVGHPIIYNHRISSPVFNRRFGGDEPSYSEFQQQLVECELCHQQLQRVSLPRHLLFVHNEYQRPTRRANVLPNFEQTAQTYHISMDDTHAVDCPVPTCPANYTTKTSMKTHFQFRHWNHKVIIMEEGELPQCTSCFAYGATVNSNRHKNSQTCLRGTIRHQRRLQQLQNNQAQSSEIFINNTKIQHVNTFKYLGRPLSANSNDIPAVQYNLQKATKTWGRFNTLLKREGANRKTMANFYETIIQSSLLYASETWNIPQDGINNIEVFHNKVARHITNRHIRKIRDTDTWYYPNMNEVFKDIGLSPIQQYIDKRKKKLMVWAQNRSIYHETLPFPN